MERVIKGFFTLWADEDHIHAAGQYRKLFTMLWFGPVSQSAMQELTLRRHTNEERLSV